MCCDCGLTHRIDFRVRVRNDWEPRRVVLEMRAVRDARSTALARRRKDLPMRSKARR
jgi:hypothetical protein